MIYFTYNLVLTFILTIYVSYLLIRALIQKDFRTELLERMGYFHYVSSKRTIWLHAASVGEISGSIPILKKIKEEFPANDIIITTMTRSGNETAKKSFPEAKKILFFPIDHPFFLNNVIKKIKPALLLIAETELWPNLIMSCRRLKIPIIIFNGRISKKSFPRYNLFKSFFKSLLNQNILFLMQTEEDRDRILSIGAPLERTKVMGNLKFDITPSPSWEERRIEFSKLLMIDERDLILIAGSTHSGEEEVILEIYKRLKNLFPNLILILAPRHISRIAEVEEILKKKSISWIKRTSLQTNIFERNPHDVILIDTIGELMNLYSLASLAFIGGSLVPVGGHNPIEPLLFKKCVLFGPHMFNFKEISGLLIKEGGAIMVKDDKELYYQLMNLLSDETLRNQIGERGYKIIENNRGAKERIFEEIKNLLFNLSF